MPRERITFSGSLNTPLAAYLDTPDTPPRAWALFAHCFTCSKNLKAVNAIASALTRAGVGVMRFDFTGLGESEGDFAHTNFSSNVNDLLLAAHYLEANVAAPRLLIGHSLGGAAILQAAQALPAAQAVVTIGAPCDPAHIRHLLASQESEIEAQGEATVILAGRKFCIQRQFLEDLDQARMNRRLHQLKKALLICHAPQDNVVGIENATHLFQEARHPKSFLSLGDADHLLTNREDARYVGGVIAAWSLKYLHT